MWQTLNLRWSARTALTTALHQQIIETDSPEPRGHLDSRWSDTVALKHDGRRMEFYREWAMPSPQTFSIRPIRHLLGRWIPPCHLVVDPAARDSLWGTHTNDLNPNTRARFHLHAVEFLTRMLQADLRFDAALLDLPYYEPP